MGADTRSNLTRLPAEAGAGDASLERLVQIGDLHRCAYGFAEALSHYERAQALLDPPGGDYAPDAFSIAMKRVDCYMGRGQLGDAARALEQAERFAGEPASADTRAEILGRRGILDSRAGRYTEALTACRSALSLLRERSDAESLRLTGQLHLAIGHATERLGRTQDASVCFERALALFESIQDQRGVAHAFNTLALNRKRQNRFREALTFLHRALQTLEEVGDYGRRAPTCLNLGILYTRLGEWSPARVQLDRAVQIAREIDQRGTLIRAHIASGNLFLRMRAFASAKASYDEAETLARDADYARELILIDEFQGERLVATGRAAASLERFARARAAAERLAPRGDLLGEILRREAEAHDRLGNREQARRTAEAAKDAADACDDRIESALARIILAVQATRDGNGDDGSATFDAAVASLSRYGAAYEIALGHVAMARAALDAGVRPSNESVVRHHLAAARTGFERFGVPGYLADVFLVATEHQLLRGDPEQADELLRTASRYVEASEESELLERQLRLRARIDRANDKRLEQVEWVVPGQELSRLFRAGAVESAVDAFLQNVLRRTSSDVAILARGATPDSLEVVSAEGLSKPNATRRLAGAAAEVRACASQGLPAIHRAADTGMPESEDVNAFAVAALCLPQDICGVLYVDRSREHVVGPYRPSDVKMVALLAELASISVLAVERTEILKEREALRRKGAGATFSRPILYESPVIEDILRTVSKVADSPASVLLSGETGTGKGLFARAIHESGRRRDAPFVQINCAALPEPLLESELFGHVSGAFTGATKSKVGLFEEAEGGTIMLDEVDKTSRAVQAKLLHVLDHREIRPLGANRWKQVDARIVSATNADLGAMIERGEFLEDLYYRLNDITVHIPPLRERREDIELLAHHFATTFAVEMGREPSPFAPDLLDALFAYRWPGNVRELEKVMRRLVVMSDEGGVLGIEQLPPEIRRGGGPAFNGANATSLKGAVRRLERRMIHASLEACGGNKSEVARRLRISYPTLLSKVRQYDL